MAEAQPARAPCTHLAAPLGQDPIEIPTLWASPDVHSPPGDKTLPRKPLHPLHTPLNPLSPFSGNRNAARRCSHGHHHQTGGPCPSPGAAGGHPGPGHPRCHPAAPVPPGGGGRRRRGCAGARHRHKADHQRSLTLTKRAFGDLFLWGESLSLRDGREEARSSRQRDGEHGCPLQEPRGLWKCSAAFVDEYCLGMPPPGCSGTPNAALGCLSVWGTPPAAHTAQLPLLLRDKCPIKNKPGWNGAGSLGCRLRAGLGP